MTYEFRIDTEALNAGAVNHGVCVSEVHPHVDWPEILNRALEELPPQTFTVMSAAGPLFDMCVTVDCSTGFDCDFSDVSITVGLRQVGDHDRADYLFVEALNTSAVTATDRAASAPGVDAAVDDPARSRALLDWVIQTAKAAVLGLERLVHIDTGRLLAAAESGRDQSFADLAARSRQVSSAVTATSSHQSANALNALAAYAEATCSADKPMDTLLTDLCGDLMHLADTFGIDPEQQMLAAVSGYRTSSVAAE